jgi:hypothetical protein
MRKKTYKVSLMVRGITAKWHTPSGLWPLPPLCWGEDRVTPQEKIGMWGEVEGSKLIHIEMASDVNGKSQNP